MDSNHDGVLTIQEWETILAPRISAQKEYVNIMKNIDINDPLDLEEKILDIQFNKRRLENEVKIMRRTKQSD